MGTKGASKKECNYPSCAVSLIYEELPGQKGCRVYPHDQFSLVRLKILLLITVQVFKVLGFFLLFLVEYMLVFADLNLRGPPKFSRVYSWYKKSGKRFCFSTKKFRLLWAVLYEKSFTRNSNESIFKKSSRMGNQFKNLPIGRYNISSYLLNGCENIEGLEFTFGFPLCTSG